MHDRPRAFRAPSCQTFLISRPLERGDDAMRAALERMNPKCTTGFHVNDDDNAGIRVLRR